MQSARRPSALWVLIGLAACSGSKSAQMLPTDTMFQDSATPTDAGRPVDTGLGGSGDGGSGDESGGSGDESGDGGSGDESGGDESGGDESGGSDEGGEAGGDPALMVADFSLDDLNPSSLTYGQPVSPRDVLTQVSGWYFTHST
jgi:hypothetical protein